MPEIRMGVVGCGSIAEIAHLPSIARCKEATLVAVCDINPDTAKQIAAQWGAEKWFTDYRDMYAQTNWMPSSSPPPTTCIGTRQSGRLRQAST